MPTVRKVRSGVSFDQELVELLDKQALALRELGVDRSEVVNAVLTDFFEGNGTTESVWEAVNKRRVRRRQVG